MQPVVIFVLVQFEKKKGGLGIILDVSILGEMSFWAVSYTNFATFGSILIFIIEENLAINSLQDRATEWHYY